MPTRPAQAAGIPLAKAAFADPHSDDDAWKAWQRHVDAGRIGNRTGRTFDQRVRMMRNEVALFGRVVTRELEEF